MTVISQISPAAAAASTTGTISSDTTTVDANGAVRTDKHEITIDKPGFFGKIARAFRDNPGTTTVVAASATGLGVASAMNYHYTGRAMPSFFSAGDAEDVARAISQALS
jgi:hypothetical protein